MRDRLPLRRMLLDAVAVIAMVAGAGLAFGPAYGGARFVIALAVGAAVGAAAALLPVLLRWPALTTLPLVLAGYLLFGGWAAVPKSAAGAVLPTLETVRSLSVGAISSWKQMLTVAVPVGSSGTLLLPAYLSAVVLAVAGLLIAVRSSRPMLALIAPGLMAAGAAALGADQAFHPAIAGTALGLGALLWAGWRCRSAGAGGLDLRRPVALLGLLVPAVAAGVLLGPRMLPADQPRVIAREVVQPPYDPTTLPGPLTAYRHYVKTVKDQVLLTVDGLPAQTRMRLATMDTYNGRYYGTSPIGGVFSRVGDRLAQVPAGQQATVDVTIGRYADVWVPDAGYLDSVAFGGPDSARLQQDFRYNRNTGSALVTSRLRPGDHYRLTVSLPAPPSVAQLAKVPVEPLDVGPVDTAIPEVGAKAQEFSAGQPDPVGVVESIRLALYDKGWVSHGSGTDGVAGGHGADRIRRLLTAKTMFGDAEQYAVAMALMVRSKNIPARVVMGFKPQPKGGAVELTGSQMTAWVEVPFQGYGWVPFDPLPDEAKPPPTQRPDENQSQAQAQRVQPPPPPIPPKDARAQSQDQPSNPDTPDQAKVQKDAPPPPPSSPVRWGRILLVGAAGLLLVLPIVLILLLKRRRKRRLRGGPPDQRIAGAWTHLLDTAADYGRSPSPGATRVEAARELGAAFGARQPAAADARAGVGAGARAGARGATMVAAGGRPAAPLPPAGRDVAMLALQADSGVFSPDPVEPAAAERFWAEMEKALASMQSTQPGWRRLRARLSLASLRGAGRRAGR